MNARQHKTGYIVFDSPVRHGTLEYDPNFEGEPIVPWGSDVTGGSCCAWSTHLPPTLLGTNGSHLTSNGKPGQGSTYSGTGTTWDAWEAS